MRVHNLGTGMVVYDLSTRDPVVHEACGGQVSFCFPMGVDHVSHDDRDFITTTLVRTHFRGTLTNLYPSVIARFELTQTPREVFSIRALDFRGLPNQAAHCAQGPEQPYANPNLRGCSIQMAHGTKLVEDRPEEGFVRFVVADTLNARVLGVSLDYGDGGTVGRVDFALGLDNPGWPAYGLPNSAQYLVEPDGDYLLVTFFANGERRGSAGSLVMFKAQVDGSWERQWQFPEAGSSLYLHSVHMGEVLTDPATGERTLFYAHGRALATDWGGDPNSDLGGSTGIMSLGASLSAPPTYLGEGVPFFSEIEGAYRPFRYARDAEFLPDGRLVLTDASCENFCPEPGQHFITQPFHLDRSPSARIGNFSPDHAQQDIIDLGDSDVDEVIRCGHGGIFETDYVAPSAAGAHLRAADARATLSCVEAAGEGE